MISECLIGVDDRCAWEAALDGIPHGFAHTWGNCHAMSLTTGDPTHLYSFDADGVRIVCPIAERAWGPYADVYTPFGFSGFVGTGDHPAFAETWMSFVARRGYVCGYFGLNPLLPAKSHLLPGQIVTYNEVFALDLTKPDEQLLRALDRNRRRELADFDARAGEFKVPRPSAATFFLEHYAQFFRERRASPAYAFSRQTFEALFQLDNVLLVGIRGNGAVECVLVIGYTLHAGECLFQVSLPSGRHHTSRAAWYGARQLRSLGVPVLNLGGGVRPGDNIAASKRRWGAEVRPLQCARQVYRDDVYIALCRAAGVDPNPESSYFPPYRARTRS